MSARGARAVKDATPGAAKKRRLPPATEKAEVPVALRRHAALTRRAQGLTYRAIAEALLALAAEVRALLHVPDGYDAKAAHRDVAIELAAVRAEKRVLARDLLELEREGLRVVRERLFERFLGAEGERGDVSIAGDLLRVHDRSMRLEGLTKEPGSKENPLTIVFQQAEQGLL